MMTLLTYWLIKDDIVYRQDALANWCTAVGLADSLNANLKPQLLRVQLSMQGKIHP